MKGEETPQKVHKGFKFGKNGKIEKRKPDPITKYFPNSKSLGEHYPIKCCGHLDQEKGIHAN